MKYTLTLMMILAVGLTVTAQDDTAGEPAGGHFAQLDTNGDGLVDIDEFGAGAQNRFSRLDADGDGFLSEEELKAGHGRHGRRHAAHMHGMLVRLADADGSGDITAAEWTSFLAAITVEGSNEVSPEAIHTLLEERFGGERPHRRPPQSPDGADQPRHPGDVDGNGVFDTADLNQFFTELDANGDGALSAEELPQRGPHPGRGPHGEGAGKHRRR